MILCITYVNPTMISANEAAITISSPSAILMEASTGQVIYENNADEKLRPASVTKVMTLLLIFDAIDSGKITMNDEVIVLEHAASMGGSQVFLEVAETQTVDTMIKCIPVASANDAAVAMAEHISGSEEAFVKRMNDKAKELGMNNTNFVNCCGLDADGHVTTARDIALMSRELINKHPQIHEYSTIWMDTITHKTAKGESEFGLSNTNKLIKQYQWATGLKTGSTGLAKCCLAATAKKDDLELVAVIMAAPDSKTRFADAISLLNYGFASCTIYVDHNMEELPELKVSNGVEDTIRCRYDKTYKHMFTNNIDESKITKKMNMLADIEAPITNGDVVGELVYYYDNEVIGKVDILADEDMNKGGIIDYFGKIMKIYAV